MSQPFLDALATQQGTPCKVLLYLVLPTVLRARYFCTSYSLQYSVLTPLLPRRLFPSKLNTIDFFIGFIQLPINYSLVCTSTLRQPATSSALVQAKPCFCARPFNALPWYFRSTLPFASGRGIVSYEVLRCAGFQCLSVSCLLAGLLAGFACWLPCSLPSYLTNYYST